MKILLLLLLLALFLGPLRRPYLRNARFSIPATVGAAGGLVLGFYLVGRAGAPPFLALVLAAALGVSFGEAVAGWCDKVFGPREGRR